MILRSWVSTLIAASISPTGRLVRDEQPRPRVRAREIAGGC